MRVFLPRHNLYLISKDLYELYLSYVLPAAEVLDVTHASFTPGHFLQGQARYGSGEKDLEI